MAKTKRRPEKVWRDLSELGAAHGLKQREVAESDETPTLLLKVERNPRGRPVTRVYHLPGNMAEIAKRLRKQLGTGGGVSDGILWLQGDHRAGVKSYLETRGYRVVESLRGHSR